MSSPARSRCACERSGGRRAHAAELRAQIRLGGDCCGPEGLRRGSNGTPESPWVELASWIEPAGIKQYLTRNTRNTGKPDEAGSKLAQCGRESEIRNKLKS